jgi:hypothetical protein
MSHWIAWGDWGKTRMKQVIEKVEEFAEKIYICSHKN